MAGPFSYQFQPTGRMLSPTSQVHASDDDDDFSVVYGLTSKLQDAENALAIKTQEADELKKLFKEAKEAKKGLTTRIEELERQRDSVAHRHSKNLERYAKLSVDYGIACYERDEWKERHAEVESEVAALRVELDARPVVDHPLSGGALHQLGSPTVSSAPPGNGATWKKHANWYGNESVYIKIQDMMYRVSKQVLGRQSIVFLQFFDGAKGATEENPIELEGITMFELDSLLSVLHASPFADDLEKLDLARWAAVLYASTKLSFDRIREHAISRFDTTFTHQDSLSRLELAFRCHVPKWVTPAYDELCRRPTSLTAEEGERFGWVRFAAICRFREMFASGHPPRGWYRYLAEFSTDEPVIIPLKDCSHEKNPTKAGSRPQEPKPVDESTPCAFDASSNVYEGCRTVSKLLEEREQECIAEPKPMPNPTIVGLGDTSGFDDQAMGSGPSEPSGQLKTVFYAAEDDSGCSFVLRPGVPQPVTQEATSNESPTDMETPEETKRRRKRAQKAEARKAKALREAAQPQKTMAEILPAYLRTGHWIVPGARLAAAAARAQKTEGSGNASST